MNFGTSKTAIILFFFKVIIKNGKTNKLIDRTQIALRQN